MPRIRITTRRLMIVVAVLALSLRAVLWVGEMRRRSAAYRERGDAFFWEVRPTSGSAVFVTTKDGRQVNVADDENVVRRYLWASRMADKYWRLAIYPWLTPEPDPPPPQPLAHPRKAVDLPPEENPLAWEVVPVTDGQDFVLEDPAPQPPVWTYLWTWPVPPYPSLPWANRPTTMGGAP